MNVKLLQEVRDYIKENPKELNLQHWETCIAGLSYRVRGLSCTLSRVFEGRQSLFDLNDSQHNELFLVRCWSNETIKADVLNLLGSYFQSNEEISSLTIKYIDYFINKYTQPIPYTQEMSDEDDELLRS